MESWIDYDLPKELIAQQPLTNRADARLMVIDRQRGTIAHHHIRDLPRLLRAEDRVVLNDTKVLPAGLRGVRQRTGGRWQGLYLGQIESIDGQGTDWKLVGKTRGRLQEPEPIMLLDRDGREAVRLWLIERLPGGQWRAHPECEEEPLTLLDAIGRIPLPPYIRSGRMVDADVQNYQTVYAQRPGAVAAPTAGLHFTEVLLRELESAGVRFSSVTLHVGMGTFRPITVEDPAQHPMHCEWAEMTSATAQELAATRAAGGRIIAVGTTVTRTLETDAARRISLAGVQSTTSGVQSTTSGVQSTTSGVQSTTPGVQSTTGWCGETDLFIRPPYSFQAIDVLLTNFHFPRTTLLLLVQAFGGIELIREAYEEAIREEYRFYSYGDAMMVV
ncbi:MAG: S-adenosylmethionine:tRNA ribosyltransferase-isomerase [Pirellulales bacterium]